MILAGRSTNTSRAAAVKMWSAYSAGAERVHLERDRISLPNRIRDAHLALSGQPGVNDRTSGQASHVGR